jgi:hypothetical protein
MIKKLHNDMVHVNNLLKTMHTHEYNPLEGQGMTNSEGLWPQLVHCASHPSTFPLISDKVQRGPNEVWRTLDADNSGGVS